ncbi:MAG: 2-dehydro-3-deoxy-D-gluconate 5-dehydrogenase KduD [Firmicutes bacterium]|nr:2-dehydro-3-deoxy-D-gluconate 5-dehydrogenase KduD [Bacillota bacterium]
MALFRLDGRNAVVTGGGKGLGKGMALALASAGADVAVVGLDEAALEQTAREIQGMGRRAFALKADLSEIDRLPAIVEAIERGLGPIDILVNNSGIIRRAPADLYPRADWDAVIQLNLNAVFHLCQLVGRRMLERGRGKIINIASVLSFQGGILVPAYTASKSAVAGLTRALANEWASRGVNVNAIVPGYMATDNTKALREDPERSRAILERIPAGRWGTPEDLAGAVVFLASPASDYVHGALLCGDGGWLAR